VERVVTDLGTLLHVGGLDGGAIKILGQKLRRETVAVAGDEKTATARCIREFSEELSSAALRSHW